jgi:hypothetical protein
VSQRPPAQRSAAQSARDAWPQPTVGWGHRTVRCAPDCPVSTWTVSGAPTSPKIQWSATPGMEGDPHRTCYSGCDSVWCANQPEDPTVGYARNGRRSAPDMLQWLSGGAPDCLVRHPTEGKNCLPRMPPTALSCLGAIKGTPRRM